MKSVEQMVQGVPSLPAWVEPEPGFNAQEFQDLVAAAEQDYRRLCNILRLKLLPLDVCPPVDTLVPYSHHICSEEAIAPGPSRNARTPDSGAPQHRKTAQGHYRQSAPTGGCDQVGIAFGFFPSRLAPSEPSRGMGWWWLLADAQVLSAKLSATECPKAQKSSERVCDRLATSKPITRVLTKRQSDRLDLRAPVPSFNPWSVFRSPRGINRTVPVTRGSAFFYWPEATKTVGTQARNDCEQWCNSPLLLTLYIQFEPLSIGFFISKPF